MINVVYGSMMLDCDHIFTLTLDAGDALGSIYQGSMPDPDDVSTFDVLVLCAWENQESNAYERLRVITAPGEDVWEWPVEQGDLARWQRAAITVADRVKQGDDVLVTCMAGLNRSGMVTAMALHHLTGWDGEKCVWWIQRRRESALFNPAFQRWLKENLR